jgi:hypothetical protein
VFLRLYHAVLHHGAADALDSRIRVTPTLFDLLDKRDLVLHPNGGASPSQEVGKAPTTAIT